MAIAKQRGTLFVMREYPWIGKVNLRMFDVGVRLGLPARANGGGEACPRLSRSVDARSSDGLTSGELE
jgi:hypothetical protein